MRFSLIRWLGNWFLKTPQPVSQETSNLPQTVGLSIVLLRPTLVTEGIKLPGKGIPLSLDTASSYQNIYFQPAKRV